MVFSKSFGYALRGILYLAMVREEKEKVQLDEIARQLTIPRHFLGKVMKRLVKAGVISSMKGPYGGFCLNAGSLNTPLFKLISITGEAEEFNSCVLRLRRCSRQTPCPMHKQIESLRSQWQELLSTTTVEDLLKKDQPGFIRSLSALQE